MNWQVVPYMGQLEWVGLKPNPYSTQHTTHSAVASHIQRKGYLFLICSKVLCGLTGALAAMRIKWDRARTPLALIHNRRKLSKYAPNLITFSHHFIALEVSPRYPPVKGVLESILAPKSRWLNFQECFQHVVKLGLFWTRPLCEHLHHKK